MFIYKVGQVTSYICESYIKGWPLAESGTIRHFFNHTIFSTIFSPRHPTIFFNNLKIWMPVEGVVCKHTAAWWWLNQPIWKKICNRQNGFIFPKVRVEHKKYLSYHHLDCCCFWLKLKVWQKYTKEKKRISTQKRGHVSKAFKLVKQSSKHYFC